MELPKISLWRVGTNHFSTGRFYNSPTMILPEVCPLPRIELVIHFGGELFDHGGGDAIFFADGGVETGTGAGDARLRFVVQRP